MLSSLWNDIRYAARTLYRAPGFAIAAVATIALGVGINTGIFTVLNGVLFRTLPVPDGQALVSISQAFEGVPGRVGISFSTEEYRIYSEGAETLSGLLAHSDATRTTLGGEFPQPVAGAIVTCNYFDVLRQPPALGRGLTDRDCEAGAAPVVVLAHELWTTSFDADPDVVGRTIELNRHLFAVVGVAREGTYSPFGLYRAAYFAPLPTEPLLLPNERSYDDDSRGWLMMIGRREGASLEQVRAELDVIAAGIDTQTPGRSTTLTVERATPLGMLSFLRRVLLPLSAVLMGAFSLVLMIACANVANLLLARASARSREIAVRLSLGATRARIVRQLLTESVLISIAGGVLGAVLGLWSFRALTSVVLPTLGPPGIPPLYMDVSPDFRVFGFAAALMLGTGVLFGLAPALRASNPDVSTTIKQDSAGAGSRGGRLQGVLVGGQVAMCMVLMVAAGLLLRALSTAQAIEPGFDHQNVVVASYDLESGYDAESAFVLQRRLLDEIAALPGVDAAATAMVPPLSADDEGMVIRPPGSDQYRFVPVNAVSPGYFDVVGIPVVRGRTFTDAELADGSGSVIVTEATARNLWPQQDAIGQTLSLAVGPGQEVALTVIGIARDAQVASIGETPQHYLYLPAAPSNAKLQKLLVESRADFASTASAIRSAAQALDPGLAVVIAPLEDNLGYWRTLSGTAAGLAGGLGALALLLAAVGIYGVVAYFVGRRTREIGIRMALGARARDVLALVLRRTMRPVVAGAAVGVLAAGLTSRILSGVLFGVSPLDPIGVGGSVLFVIVVALAAGILPGRRAALAQPTVALRDE